MGSGIMRARPYGWLPQPHEAPVSLLHVVPRQRLLALGGLVAREEGPAFRESSARGGLAPRFAPEQAEPTGVNRRNESPQ
jgi:hypothetical protein